MNALSAMSEKATAALRRLRGKDNDKLPELLEDLERSAWAASSELLGSLAAGGSLSDRHAQANAALLNVALEAASYRRLLAENERPAGMLAKPHSLLDLAHGQKKVAVAVGILCGWL